VGFLIIILIFGVLWMLFLLPARRRRQQHAAMQSALAVGDEIISAGGLHGRIQELGDSVVDVEIAENVVVTLDRRAVAAVAREVEVDAEPEDEPEDEDEPGAEEKPR
jgi:preprotein translocase subunit YajC